jgi:uncharacterized protein
MSHQIAVKRRIIPDPLDFSRRGESLNGEVPLAAFGRLKDELADSAGTARFVVRGESIEKDCFLVLSVEADPVLQCQRCLKAITWPLDLEARFLLVPPGREMPDEGLEEDDFDPLFAERDLDVLALVEDELLLGLPIAPRHEKCETPNPRGTDDSASPFAALAKLRGAGSTEK